MEEGSIASPTWQPRDYLALWMPRTEEGGTDSPAWLPIPLWLQMPAIEGRAQLPHSGSCGFV